MSPAIGGYVLDPIVSYPGETIERSGLSMMPIITIGQEEFLQTVPEEMLFLSPGCHLMEFRKQTVDLMIQVFRTVHFHGRFPKPLVPGCPSEQPGILRILLLLPGGLHCLDDLAEFFLHLVRVESRSLKGGF